MEDAPPPTMVSAPPQFVEDVCLWFREGYACFSFMGFVCNAVMLPLQPLLSDLPCLANVFGMLPHLHSSVGLGMVLCGSLVPISYGDMWQAGSHLLWVWVAVWFSSLWCCVAVWFPSPMVLCGRLVPISYGVVWKYGPHLLWCCVAG